MQIYIDCDGVIINTMEIIEYLFVKRFRTLLDDGKISYEEDRDFFINLDWDEILPRSKQINNSFKYIKQLYELGYIKGILTHCNSDNEKTAKLEYFKKNLPDVKVICVDKNISKSKYVDPKGCILVDDYLMNLLEWVKAGGIGIKFSDGINIDDRYIYYEENTKIGKKIHLIERIRSLEELIPKDNLVLTRKLK